MPDEKPKPKRERKPKVIPNAPQEGRPGHNGGGWLKTGNTVGVGRKPAEIRTEILATVGEAHGIMRSILDGEFKVEVRNMFGNVVGYRSATIAEITKVYDALAKHALPTKTELSGPDGGAIPIETKPDLSGLTIEEKEQLLAILEKAESAKAA